MATDSLSSVAYYRILQCLLDQSLPVQQKISETALAKQLGISRTPIREAIRRLESEGFLYQVAGSGTFRSEPDRTQLIEAYEIREALECQAVTKATRLMTPRELAELQLQCDNMHSAIAAYRASGEEDMSGERLKLYLVADLKFHLLLLQAANNRTAMKIVTDRRIRDCAFGDSSHCRTLHHLSQVWLLHARIARSVKKRDSKSARKWMRKHIRASLHDALAAFDDWQTNKSPRRSMPTEVNSLLEDVIKSSEKKPRRGEK